jgi:hypothetical protein
MGSGNGGGGGVEGGVEIGVLPLCQVPLGISECLVELIALALNAGHSRSAVAASWLSPSVEQAVVLGSRAFAPASRAPLRVCGPSRTMGMRNSARACREVLGLVRCERVRRLPRRLLSGGRA